MNKYKCEGDLFCGMNVVKDKQNMTDLEKKHTPVIEAPGKVEKGEQFEVTVEVGRHMKHPNIVSHFIQWVALYSGETLLGRVEFVPEYSEPKIKVLVMLKHAHPLIAMGRCNLHGLWSSEPKSIEVT